MPDNYVCRDHPTVVLGNVRQIRPDIGRPNGVNVVGECEECRATKPLVLSYGIRPTLSVLHPPLEGK